ncbi:MAG: DUF72 domain-containing protein [Thermodesulfovibrio sp.]|nr:DUF72 domain-containing protein [Thermodesulfovibrio sp.]
MEQTLQRRLKFFVGTSGWQYGHWKGIFYPPDLKYSEWLQFYSKNFLTVEINVTFYRDVRSSTFQQWYSKVNRDFIFSLKMTRNITHFKRLRIDKETIDRFIERVSFLREKLGVILIQLPPSLKFDESLINEFCQFLDKKYSYAIEVRNKTFINDNFFIILQRENIAFCIADSAGRYPYYEAITADFVYIRLHGSQRLYASEYTDEELLEWAKKLKNWNRLSYIYFDNDYMGYAIKNALKLKKLLTL